MKGPAQRRRRLARYVLRDEIWRRAGKSRDALPERRANSHTRTLLAHSHGQSPSPSARSIRPLVVAVAVVAALYGGYRWMRGTSTLEQVVVTTGDEQGDPFELLGRCTTLECVSALHPSLQAAGAKFNFPHFFLAGWQKAATTSIYRHLRHHPEIQIPFDKEPHYFSSCKFGAPACKVKGGYSNASDYLVSFLGLEAAAASRVGYAAFDGSVDYAQKGSWLAPILAKLFPYLRMVFVFREKVGRSMSYKNMLAEKSGKGCGDDLFKCLNASMNSWGSYSESTQAWYDHFPAAQIHAIQFEELVEDPDGVLRRLKSFLGIDPELPPRELTNTNRRASSGWAMSRADYAGLVETAKADQERLLRVLEEHASGVDGAAWRRRWDALVDRNLATCNQDAVCDVASML